MKTTFLSLLFCSVLLAACASRPPAPLSPQDQVRIAAASEVYEQFVRYVHDEHFAEAAALFSADARMTNHALTSAKGPAEIQAMLEKLSRREVFFGQANGAIKGDGVVLSGPCVRTLRERGPFPGEARFVGPAANMEFSTVLHLGSDGIWRFAYFETFQIPHAVEEGNSGSANQELGTASTP